MQKKYNTEEERKAARKANITAWNKKHYEANKEKLNKENAEYKKLNPHVKKKADKKWYEKTYMSRKEQLKNNHLKDKYNITLDDYNKMLYEQNGVCKICGIHHTEVKKGLHVDHCHSTGKIRGLLCVNCNNMLGHAKDNIKTLQAAIKYLK